MIHHGDCLEILPTLPAESIDAIVTDPPYGLSFMGKNWDHGIPGVAFWSEALRVAKPGTHLLAFGGTRTFHRLTCAIEDAGWEIRDCIMWVYGSGFPKSRDVSKAIDQEAGAEREVVGIRTNGNKGGGAGTYDDDSYVWDKPFEVTAPATPAAQKWQGWGTALKPAWEPIIVARKPLMGTVAQNVQAYGTGAVNVDGCRVGSDSTRRPLGKPINGGSYGADRSQRLSIDAIGGSDSGRWPANLIHDGSDDVVELFPDSNGSGKARTLNRGDRKDGWGMADKPGELRDAGSGSAARFFMKCNFDEIELHLCRAKAIIHAWNIDLASTAESSLSLSSQYVDSVLSRAVIAATLGDRLLRGVTGLSTNVTVKELETICETLIAAILITEKSALPDQLQGVKIPNGILVKNAEKNGQTGITTITISLPKYGGYAENVTFTITSKSKEVGDRDYPARIRYCAKASKADRDEGCEGLGTKRGGALNMRTDAHSQSNGMDTGPRRNHHPTVKPTALMRYLCRLVTPPGGTVLDPFCGSGSTGKAATLEGFDFIGIEREAEYVEIARARIAHARGDMPLLANA